MPSRGIKEMKAICESYEFEFDKIINFAKKKGFTEKFIYDNPPILVFIFYEWLNDN
jgi:hypothetical protein